MYVIYSEDTQTNIYVILNQLKCIRIPRKQVEVISGLQLICFQRRPYAIGHMYNVIGIYVIIVGDICLRILRSGRIGQYPFAPTAYFFQESR